MGVSKQLQSERREANGTRGEGGKQHFLSPRHVDSLPRVVSHALPGVGTRVVHVFVLGIDPGLSRCGYGCLESGRRPRAVSAGVIRTDPSIERPIRLAELQREVRELIAEFRPQTVAIERVFFQHNVRTAMTVGMVSGIVMAEAAAAGCDVAEYSPNEVKQAVAGWGGADKVQIGQMVQTLLGLSKPLKPADTADAVAIALCHLARQSVGVPGGSRS